MGIVISMAYSLTPFFTAFFAFNLTTVGKYVIVKFDSNCNASKNHNYLTSFWLYPIYPSINKDAERSDLCYAVVGLT